METTIYYFTGTGNSLAVARDLCERLGDCRAVPIASLREEPGPVRTAADRVGIVYPVYFSGVPSIVAEIAARLDLGGVQYVFAVCTMGSSGAAPSLRQLDRVLRTGPGGRGLDAGFAVRMPGNYILLYDLLGDVALERTLADAGRRVEAIAEAVGRGEQTMPRFSPAGAVIHRVFYPRFLAGVHGADAKFTVDDRCTACGTCAAVCPVGNVRLEAGRPAWLHRCEQCMACVQHCPVQAIQAGPKTASRRRYRHPGITVEALADRDGE
ncbi:MAG: EFR1 family ferrodoxin [Methanospirillum sp.]